ncbi:MAG: glutaredoxin 3 [bacterium]
MPEIDIYTTQFCPYCVMAKRLLAKKGVEYNEIKVDFNRGMRAEMIERANGRTSVPQIFINGKHIGGCDDMTELDYNGELDALLVTSKDNA